MSYLIPLNFYIQLLACFYLIIRNAVYVFIHLSHFFILYALGINRMCQPLHRNPLTYLLRRLFLPTMTTHPHWMLRRTIYFLITWICLFYHFFFQILHKPPTELQLYKRDKVDCSAIQLCCDMDNHRTTVGFSCLPSELLQSIFLRLALPEIVRLKSINKSIASVVSDRDFVRDCNSQTISADWLFIYSKGWRRDSVLHGFTDQCDHWFKLPIAGLLMPVIHETEDLYFLAASGNFFLFVSNTCKELLSVNLMSRTVKKIPPSPLGPRGTSSWRRSGMKLVAGPPVSDSFRFLFAELVENRPILFEYNSDDGKWQSVEAEENHGDLPRVFEGAGPLIFLSVINGTNESVVLAVGSQGSNTPVVLRPRFSGGAIQEGQVAVGFGWGNGINKLQVYGDGFMMIVRSDDVGDGKTRERVLKGIDMWGLSPNGRRWERISKLPVDRMEQVKKAYGVMMGCVEERNGTIRALLMSNYQGLWHIIWLSYDIGRDDWTLLPLPDFDMKGLNMAGITFSSGLTLL